MQIVSSKSASPLGEIFRARLRQFPALVNCCTIDWYDLWPAEALQSVATKALENIEELDRSEDTLWGLVIINRYRYNQ